MKCHGCFLCISITFCSSSVQYDVVDRWAFAYIAFSYEHDKIKCVFLWIFRSLSKLIFYAWHANELPRCIRLPSVPAEQLNDMFLVSLQGVSHPPPTYFDCFSAGLQKLLDRITLNMVEGWSILKQLKNTLHFGAELDKWFLFVKGCRLCQAN